MTVFSLFRNVSPSRGFCAAAPAASALFLLSATISASAADIVVSGLPSGLTVGVRVATGTCVTGGGRFSSTGVTLTERAFRRFEPSSIGGSPGLRLIEGSTYEGDRIVDTFSAAGTQCPPDQQFAAVVTVLGRREGNTFNSMREAGGGIATWTPETGTSKRLVLKSEVHAKTARVVDSDAQAPPGPTLNRDVVVNWSVGYDDSFGAGSVVEPRLEFFTTGLAGLPRGSRGSLSTLLFRVIVTADNRACLMRALGPWSCGPVNQNISLSSGNVTVTRVSVTASGTSRSVAWRFRLAPDFPTGQFEVVARARDQAPLLKQRRFLYRVAGPPRGNRPTFIFRDLELLPWEESSFFVTVQ